MVERRRVGARGLQHERACQRCRPCAPRGVPGGKKQDGGGLGKAHQLFGEQLPNLLDELNEVLAA